MRIFKRNENKETEKLPMGRKSRKSNMQMILFTARPSPMHTQKAYACAVTLLPGFAAKFFRFAPAQALTSARRCVKMLFGQASRAAGTGGVWE